MWHFEKFVTDGKEKADVSWRKKVLRWRFMAQTRSNTVKQEREEVYAALQYAASFHCLKNGQIAKSLSLSLKSSGSSCTRKGRKRSIRRSGVSQQTSIGAWDVEEAASARRWKENAQDQKAVDQRLEAQVQKVGKIAYGRTRHGKECGQAGRSFEMVQKML